MTRDEIHVDMRGAMGELVGVLWFIGWLFTIGYAHLPFLKAVFALIAWPYYLGSALS